MFIELEFYFVLVGHFINLKMIRHLYWEMRIEIDLDLGMKQMMKVLQVVN